MIIATTKDREDWLNLHAKMEVELIIHDHMLEEAWTEHRRWSTTESGTPQTPQ